MAVATAGFGTEEVTRADALYCPCAVLVLLERIVCECFRTYVVDTLAEGRKRKHVAVAAAVGRVAEAAACAHEPVGAVGVVGLECVPFAFLGLNHLRVELVVSGFQLAYHGVDNLAVLFGSSFVLV